jgi:hypothetical protein
MSEEMLTETDDVVAETTDVSSDAESSESEGQQTQAVAETTEAAPQRSVWDAFRSLPNFEGQDDIAIARRLYGALEAEKTATDRLAQYQQYIPHAHEYLRNRPQFEAWKAAQQQSAGQPQQQQAQQPQESAVKKWWNPPELRDSYKQYLVKDETGREVIAPEAPLDAKHALYEYQKYKADFAQKFLTDPESALGPMVQDIAQQQAAQIVQQQFQQFAERSYVSNLEQDNKDWLFAEDGQTPTEEGQLVRQYIDVAAQKGLQEPTDRWEYATMRVELDLLRKLMSQQQDDQRRSAFESQLAAPAPAPNVSNRAQQDIDFLRREATRNPSRASATYAEPAGTRQPLTFEQKLARQFGRE